MCPAGTADNIGKITKRAIFFRPIQVYRLELIRICSRLSMLLSTSASQSTYAEQYSLYFAPGA